MREVLNCTQSNMQSNISKTNSSNIFNVTAFLLTCALVLTQFVVAARYEPVAQMVGVMDSQSRMLNTTYLDYEEQNAILRSSKFLVAERAAGYVTSPSKVLYVNPGSQVISSNE